MSSPRFEVPSGTIDGVNTVFTVSRPYGAGTTAVFINGQLMEKSLEDGWFETDPTSGVITLKEAPRSSGACPDVIQVFYLDTAAPLPETQICRLKGYLKSSPKLRGLLSCPQEMRGVISTSSKLTGRVDLRKRFRGRVEDSCKIRARIRICGD
jgi:hypothetical protein